MTYTRRLMGLGAVLVSAGVGAGAACSPSAKQLPPDGLTLPTYDGSTVTLTEDSGPGPLRVLVLGALGPEAGVEIVFQDPTGAVLDTAQTDALGRASRDMPSGGQVTALFGTPTQPAAITWVAVQPGDLLVARDPLATPVDASVVSFPPLPLEGGALLSGYAVESGNCVSYGAAPPILLGLDPLRCVGPLGRFPVLALAEDSNGQPFAFASQRDNAPSADGGVGLGGAWSTTFGKWNVTAANTPTASVPLVAFYSEVADGVPTSEATFQVSPGGGADVAFALPTHPGFPEFVQTEVGAEGGSGQAYSAVAVRASAPSPDGSATVDLSKLLPAITAASPDFTKDPTHPSLSVSYVIGTGGDAGTLASIAWLDGTQYIRKDWVFVLPPGVTKVTAPSLPPSASAWVPQVVESPLSPVVASLSTSTGFSAADFRHLAAALPLRTTLLSNTNQPQVPILVAAGASAAVTVFGPPG